MSQSRKDLNNYIQTRFWFNMIDKNISGVLEEADVVVMGVDAVSVAGCKVDVTSYDK